MKEQFADVKVGDRVWSINHGRGGVVRKGNILIEINFGYRENVRFDKNGYRYGENDLNQTLFWDEIAITPPEKPKREVTHAIERWVNVYPDHMGSARLSEESANMDATFRRIACVKLTGTYETMED